MKEILRVYRASAEEYERLFYDYTFSEEDDGKSHDAMVAKLQERYNYIDIRCNFEDWYITMWGIKGKVAELIDENTTGYGARETVLSEVAKLEEIASLTENEFENEE